jgi:hypothetical protein
MEAWVYPNSLSASQNIFSYWGGAATTCAFDVRYVATSGQITMAYGVGGTNANLNSNAKVTAGQWNHVAITRKGSVVRFFVNGVMDSTLYTISGPMNQAATPLYIGAGATGALNGYITDARLVNGTALYVNSFTPPTTPAVSVTNTSLLYNAQSAGSAGIFDNTMVNNTNAIGNTKISTTQSKFGGSALAFDGSNSGVWLPDAPQLNFYSNNFTIECWFNATSAPSAGALFGKRNASTEFAQCEFQWSSGTVLTFYATTASGSWPIQLATPAISFNTWYHFAAVRNGNTFTIYLNGNSVATGTLSGALYYNPAPFVIGGSSQSYAGGGAPWNGYIDDFRITNGIARYTGNFTPPTAPYPNQ